jgi:hypothetical protein
MCWRSRIATIGSGGPVPEQSGVFRRATTADPRIELPRKPCSHRLPPIVGAAKGWRRRVDQIHETVRRHRGEKLQRYICKRPSKSAFSACWRLAGTASVAPWTVAAGPPAPKGKRPQQWRAQTRRRQPHSTKTSDYHARVTRDQPKRLHDRVAVELAPTDGGIC